jgi:hypothetical protein
VVAMVRIEAMLRWPPPSPYGYYGSGLSMQSR